MVSLRKVAKGQVQGIQTIVDLSSVDNPGHVIDCFRVETKTEGAKEEEMCRKSLWEWIYGKLATSILNI